MKKISEIHDNALTGAFVVLTALPICLSRVLFGSMFYGYTLRSFELLAAALILQGIYRYYLSPKRSKLALHFIRGGVFACKYLAAAMVFACDGLCVAWVFKKFAPVVLVLLALLVVVFVLELMKLRGMNRAENA